MKYNSDSDIILTYSIIQQEKKEKRKRKTLEKSKTNFDA